MMWLRKSKKGFTLIELMVVVAVIGVLALLGLRLYTGQQEKSKNAIVIANTSTVHTLIQGDLLDHDYLIGAAGAGVLINIGGDAEPRSLTLANMENPFVGDVAVLTALAISDASVDVTGAIAAGNVGVVLVFLEADNLFKIQGIGSSNNIPMLTGDLMTAQK